jgi:hypothetical protein
MMTALSRQYRSNQPKANTLSRYYDWKPQVDTKTISRPKPRAVSIVPELISSGGSWVKMPEFASLWWLSLLTIGQNQLSDTSVICPAIPEKLTQ